jgi:hypothetical protein
VATVRFVSWGVIPFGALLGGAIASATGPRGGLWAACLLTLVGPVVVWFSPVRRLRDLVDLPAAPVSSAPVGSSSR